MKKQENKNVTNDKKSFKEVVIENRGKIIAGVGIVGCGLCCLLVSKKYQKEIKEITNDFTDKLIDKVKEVDNLKIKNMILEEDIIDLYEDNQTLSAILSEGVLQDAITTTSNKINNRKNKLSLLEAKNDPSKNEYISKIKGDLETLIKRKDLYETKLHKYEIKDLAD